MERMRKAVAVLAVAVWPVTEAYWRITSRYELPFFVSVLCGLWLLWSWATEQAVDGADAPDAVDGGSVEQQKSYDGALFISMMRVVASKHAQKHGLVTADDLRAEAETVGIRIPPSFYPQIFRGPMFREVTKVRSRRPECKGRMIGAYALGSAA